MFDEYARTVRTAPPCLLPHVIVAVSPKVKWSNDTNLSFPFRFSDIWTVHNSHDRWSRQTRASGWTWIAKVLATGFHFHFPVSVRKLYCGGFNCWILPLCVSASSKNRDRVMSCLYSSICICSAQWSHYPIYWAICLWSFSESFSLSEEVAPFSKQKPQRSAVTSKFEWNYFQSVR